VVGRQMKDDAHPLDRALRGARPEKVVVKELDSSIGNVVLDVLELPAAQVVEDADGCAAYHELVDERRADERGAAGDERRTAAPPEGT